MTYDANYQRPFLRNIKGALIASVSYGHAWAPAKTGLSCVVYFSMGTNVFTSTLGGPAFLKFLFAKHVTARERVDSSLQLYNGKVFFFYYYFFYLTLNILKCPK